MGPWWAWLRGARSGANEAGCVAEHIFAFVAHIERVIPMACFFGRQAGRYHEYHSTGVSGRAH